MSALLFKVLLNGRSMNGGSLAWSLPKDGQPGEWHQVDGALVVCRNGLHLTDWVAHWWKPNCTAYVVEAEGIEGDCNTGEGRKVVARRVRLMREATAAELAASGVVSEGVHDFSAVLAGRPIVASGSSQVTASGSSQVTASDSSKVTAYGSSKVTANGSSQVTAYDSSKVTAYGSSQVTAKDDVTIVSWRGKAGMKVTARAVCVVRDYKQSRPVIMMAKASKKAARP